MTPEDGWRVAEGLVEAHPMTNLHVSARDTLPDGLLPLGSPLANAEVV